MCRKSIKKSNKIITKRYCIIEKWVIYYHYSKSKKLLLFLLKNLKNL